MGNCELCDELASGGMATVYLAVHRGAEGFGKVVAVKRLLPQYQRDPDHVAMLADEAAISARACHPSVRDVFDMGTAEDGTPYLEMEFLVGEPLSRAFTAVAERRRTGAPRPTANARVVAHMAARLCDGLHAVHELREEGGPLDVVHRDVSPANLFVLHDGSVRLTDFGIVRARLRRQGPTGANGLKGKLAYMSPEYLQRRPYDRRSDVWAMGVVIWELLTGARLFRRYSEVETARAVTSAPIPAPSAFAPDVDPQLDAIVMRALSRDPAARHATARALAVQLDGYLQRTGHAPAPADVGDWLRDLVPESEPTLVEMKTRALAMVTASGRGAEVSRTKPSRSDVEDDPTPSVAVPLLRKKGDAVRTATDGTLEAYRDRARGWG